MDQLSSGQGKGNDPEFCVYFVCVRGSLKAQYRGTAAVTVVSVTDLRHWPSCRFPCRLQAGFAHVASGKTWADSSSQERLLHVNSVTLDEIIHPELFLPSKRGCHRKRRVGAGLPFVWWLRLVTEREARSGLPRAKSFVWGDRDNVLSPLLVLLIEKPLWCQDIKKD